MISAIPVLALLILVTFGADAEPGTVEGHITNENGAFLPGIEMVFSNSDTAYHAFTDKNGYYKIRLPKGKYELNLKFYRYVYPDNFKAKAGNTSETKRYDYEIDFDEFNFDKRFYTEEQKEAMKGPGFWERLFGGKDKDKHPGGRGISADYGSDGRMRSSKAMPMMAVDSDVLAETAESADSDRGLPPKDAGPAPGAGKLTSGEVNDFRKWDMWGDLTDDQFAEYSETRGVYPLKRYTVQVINNSGNPVIDARVILLDANNTIYWSARTDNTGKAELWYDMFGESPGNTPALKARVVFENEEVEIDDISEFKNGVNIVNTNWSCHNREAVDILFAVDATGSMGDEIAYLQAELLDIISRVKEKNSDTDLRLGSLFYRDDTDDYLVKHTPFSGDIQKTGNFIKEQNAAGGGDFPEAVGAALFSAVSMYDWSESARARLLFLVLDAPPHKESKARKRIREITRRLAADGIRVIPVACSGVDKDTEFIMRAIALSTNGTYVFLTDDSGIGGKHIKPSTDEYKVEKLNDLFIRLIDQFTIVPDCNAENLAGKEVSDRIFNEGDPVKTGGDLSELVVCYPNPNRGIFTIDAKRKLDELFIVDITGKIIERYGNFPAGKHEIDISRFPTGIYFGKFMEGGEWGSAKVILQR